MSNSMAERQKFLEKKFNGNVRLAEEFAYIQDPEVTKLERWQKWKSEAEEENRWTSWQTNRADAVKQRQEKFRDPFHQRRKLRHKRRMLKREEFDVLQEVKEIESREATDWKRAVDIIKSENPFINDEQDLPAQPSKLLTFATAEVKKKPRHWMEPPEHTYPAATPPEDSSSRQPVKRSSRPGSAARVTPRDDDNDEGGAGLSVVEQRRLAARAEASADAWAQVRYRFNVWWFGYMAALAIQRVVRGRSARLWVAFRVTEPKALARRSAAGTLARLWRGHAGRQLTAVLWARRHSSAVFLQRAYRRFSQRRGRAVTQRRQGAAVALQHTWYRFNSILLGARVLGMVRNKREADVVKDGFKALYWGALRMQVLVVRYMARKRYRKRRRQEQEGAVKIQSLMRGVFVRAAVKSILKDKFAAMVEKRNGAASVLSSACRAFLERKRAQRALERKARVILLMQAWVRGMLARRGDSKLRLQGKLVRDWMGDFKKQRAGNLMDSSEIDRFYTHLEPKRRPPHRVERHKRTSIDDLPHQVRRGPLWDDSVAVPDYAALAQREAELLLAQHHHHHGDSAGRGGSGGGGVLGVEGLAGAAAAAVAATPSNRPRASASKPLPAGITVGPTSEDHLRLVRRHPAQRAARNLGAADLGGSGSGGGGGGGPRQRSTTALDAMLERRVRTVSRGLVPVHGLLGPWGSETSRLQTATPLTAFTGNRNVALEEAPPPPRPEFGPQNRVLDKGTFHLKGSVEARQLDARSGCLINAQDRKAFQGVANWPSNVREKRGKGAARIMAASLDLAAAECRARGYLPDAGKEAHL